MVDGPVDSAIAVIEFACLFLVDLGEVANRFQMLHQSLVISWLYLLRVALGLQQWVLFVDALASVYLD